MKLLKQALSYFFDIPIKKVDSTFSGTLYVAWSAGRKVLNTAEVNYSFQSLHRVFRWSFKRAGLPDSIQRVLLLGLGGGSVVEILRKELGCEAPIDVVEIDEAIINLANTEFQIHQYDPINIYHADAIHFIPEITQTYSLICLDVFVQDKVPSKLLTIPTLLKLLSQLDIGGKLFINTMMNEQLHEKQLLTLIQELESHPSAKTIKCNMYRPEENNRMLVISK